MTVIEDDAAQQRRMEYVDVLEVDERSTSPNGRGTADGAAIAWLLSPGLGAPTRVAIPAERPPARIRLRHRLSGEDHVREWERQGSSASGEPVYRLTGDSAISFPGVPCGVPD